MLFEIPANHYDDDEITYPIDLGRYRTWIVGAEGERAHHLTTTTTVRKFLQLKNVPTPVSFSIFVVSIKHYKVYIKMSIQYTVLGFEPTISRK